MSAPELASQLVDLPPAWLALLFQHVATGPGGLANAASLSQTCKFLYSLSQGPVVTYRDLRVPAATSSPDLPVWQWLARRSGRIVGLSLDLHLRGFGLGGDASRQADKVQGWMQRLRMLSGTGWEQRLQTLSGIAGLQLRVTWDGRSTDMNPCIAECLKQHGRLISHLTAYYRVSDKRLKLREFSEAAAMCRSIDLQVCVSEDEAGVQVVDLVDLAPVAGSLRRLICSPCSPCCRFGPYGRLTGASAMESMSQLTALQSICHFGNDEPWTYMAKLTSLRELLLRGTCTGDPSPLSALTGLSYLRLDYVKQHGAQNPAPFSFSSLQSLSTLRQLESLHLVSHDPCAATSLQGLAGLSSLKRFSLESEPCGSTLRSLEGISPQVSSLRLSGAQGLVTLAGIEVCTSMAELSLSSCGVSSLQALRGLSCLKHLEVGAAV
jgi:hypothetical protein